MANGIGWAVKEMQDGHRVRRTGWNGKGMWLTYVPGRMIEAALPDFSDPDAPWLPVELLPHVNMKTADNKIVPWLCSQTDLLAIDWELVGEPRVLVGA